MTRYFPVLLMMMPCRMAEGEMVIALGKRYKPESRGEAILAAWKYVGLQHMSVGKPGCHECHPQVDCRRALASEDA